MVPMGFFLSSPYVLGEMNVQKKKNQSSNELLGISVTLDGKRSMENKKQKNKLPN